MTIRVLAAGDHFVRTDLFETALRNELGDDLDLARLTLPWPYEPFRPIGEVDEACGDEDALIDGLAGASVAVTHVAPFTERVLKAASGLRLVACSRGGPVNVNVEAATKHGVVVCYAPGRNAAATAEYAVGLILAALRRIPETHASLSSGEWRGAYYAYDECGGEIDGTTVGLVGYGAVGRRVARAMVALGAEVLVADPYADPATLQPGARLVSLAELLSRSHVVSLHARLTPGTRGLIGAAEIALMPKGAVLVNTARGGLLDYDAVAKARASGHLGAVALDVFPEEPVRPDFPLLSLPDVIATPHLAGASRQTAERAARISAAEVGRFVRGEPLNAVANPEALGGER